MKLSIETIKNRVSVRTYDKIKVPDSVVDDIKKYIGQIENPFQVPIDFRILDAKEHNLGSSVIIGENTYVAAKYRKVLNAEIAFGYSFERFILFATSLGLATVWLAGTIDRKAFENAMQLKEDEVMPAVSPIGYAAKKRSVRENLMRKGLKSDDRVLFEKLFFKGDFQNPLKESEANHWLIPLQMLRLSPSATNKQPWRVVVEEKRVHFYEEKTKGYAQEKTGDIQKVDLGIAICHFEIAAEELGLKGNIIQKDPGFTIPKNTEYIATYELED
ncbi:nitroreductase [Anaerococcus sp. AGMB00486]|uniref:Nitroreductase n=2 Tax=Anaerococcus TaxID=165779 RepID=A0ABX2N9X6_9FIRM|nr:MULTISPECIES: nitroreductase family protein [Anaerococcus]MDY3006796.1 nitroreductase family protein [Anaerococcus porci]MSS78512.1 nitroreductase [Anaerococcus porci]NVF11369.1 nitroreductase [Anaerococcus faecalis]